MNFFSPFVKPIDKPICILSAEGASICPYPPLWCPLGTSVARWSPRGPSVAFWSSMSSLGASWSPLNCNHFGVRSVCSRVPPSSKSVCKRHSGFKILTRFGLTPLHEPKSSKFRVRTTGGYRPPLKTRFWEAYINAPLVFADFWKKVRVSPPPPADGPAGGKTALFSKNLRK